MNDEQINRAIAEACPDKFRNEDDVWFFQYAKDCWSQCHNNSICNDLNAMHEAEKVLKGYEQIHTYIWHLSNRKDWETDFKLMEVHISARDRAEAFLRTLGKWEEVQK